jgi:hypothetical protein
MSLIVADYLLNMNTADANGVTVDATIMGNGIQGSNAPTWAMTPATPTGLTIESHGSDRLDAVALRVSGTQFAAGSTSRRLAMEHTNPSTYAQCTLPSGAGVGAACTVAGWITMGPPDVGVSSAGVFDLVAIHNVLGHFAVLQLNNGNGGGGTGYAVNIETDPAGVTTHSTYITLVPGTRYWFSLRADFVAGSANLSIYTTAGVLVGSVTASAHTTVSNINTVRIGNGEVGTAAGTTTYFENLVIDYLKAAHPLGPTGPANYWIPKSAGLNADASLGTIAVTLAGVAAGDLVVVSCKFEGGATTATCSDGTSSLTQSAVGVQANASGDPREVMFYILSSVASGSVTYTVTFGAARTFRNIMVIANTPPANTTVALDGTAAGNTNAGSTAVDSSNMTTTGTNGMAYGGYGGFGSHITRVSSNAARPDAYQGTSTSGNALWCAAYSSGFTGSAAGTLDVSERWNAQILSFNAQAGNLSVSTIGEPVVGGSTF